MPLLLNQCTKCGILKSLTEFYRVAELRDATETT
jgi:hypothetical protein